MITIGHFQATDFEAIKSFVESIQEYERIEVPELKPGAEIGDNYTQTLIDTIADQDGLNLVARDNDNLIGFICAWIDNDDDQLLRDDARQHAYISDIFVGETWRRKGVAKLLLQAIEKEMQQRDCKRIRICTKASNYAALKCYEANDYKAYEIILSKSLSSND